MALTRTQIMEQVEAMKEQLALQEELNNSFEGYLNGVRKYQELINEVKKNRKLELDLQNKITSMTAGPARDAEQQKLDYLRQQSAEYLKQARYLRDNIKDVKKTNLLMAEGVKGLVKGFASFPTMVE